jgi:MYXO-CTERM domain-containing protein
MDLKSAGDPLAPSTQRQVLVGLAVLGGLLVWQIDTRRR